MSLPHISIYIKLYQLNKLYGKVVGLQVRKLSYNPAPVHIINNQVDMAIQHIKNGFKKKQRKHAR